MNWPFEIGSSSLRPIPFPSALNTSTLAFSRLCSQPRPQQQQQQQHQQEEEEEEQEEEQEEHQQREENALGRRSGRQVI